MKDLHLPVSRLEGLRQMFATCTAIEGGIVRRKVADVERLVGRQPVLDLLRPWLSRGEKCGSMRCLLQCRTRAGAAMTAPPKRLDHEICQNPSRRILQNCASCAKSDQCPHARSNVRSRCTATAHRCRWKRRSGWPFVTSRPCDISPSTPLPPKSTRRARGMKCLPQRSVSLSFAITVTQPRPAPPPDRHSR